MISKLHSALTVDGAPVADMPKLIQAAQAMVEFTGSAVLSGVDVVAGYYPGISRRGEVMQPKLQGVRMGGRIYSLVEAPDSNEPVIVDEVIDRLFDPELIDPDQAREFLTMLGGERNTFNVLHCTPARGHVPGLPDAATMKGMPERTDSMGVRRGAVTDKLLAELTAMNAQGGNVFVSTQHATGLGKADVTKARALFLDIDAGQFTKDGATRDEALAKASAVVDDAMTCGAEPTMVVQTGNGYHVWWRIKDGAIAVKDIPMWLKALIKRFGSDPSIHDIQRVMRVPGFLHVKNHDDPRPVTIIRRSAQRFVSLADLAQIDGLELVPEVETYRANRVGEAGVEDETIRDACRYALSCCDPMRDRDSGYREIIFAAIHAGITAEEIHGWAAGKHNYLIQDVQGMIDRFTAEKAGGVTFRTLFHYSALDAAKLGKVHRPLSSFEADDFQAIEGAPLSESDAAKGRHAMRFARERVESEADLAEAALRTWGMAGLAVLAECVDDLPAAERAWAVALAEGADEGLTVHDLARQHPSYRSLPELPIGTDIDLADSFLAMHGDSFALRVPGSAKLMAYESGVWVDDTEGRRIHAAYASFIRELHARTAQALKEKLQTDGELNENTVKNAVKSGEPLAIRLGRLRSLLTADKLKVIPALIRMRITHAPKFEHDPLAFRTPEGSVVVSAEGVSVRPSRRVDYHLNSTTVAMDLSHEPVEFIKMLNRSFPGAPEMLGFLQEYMGSMLLGVAKPNFLVLSGTGANGKSTMMTPVRSILGSHAVLVQAALGFTKDGADTETAGGPNSTMASLFGKRAAFQSEPPPGYVLNSAFYKSMTGGGEGRQTRTVYGRDDITLTPTVSFAVQMNGLPIIRSEETDAVWRRLLVYNMSENLQDVDTGLPLRDGENLGEYLLRTEGPQILGWMAKGATRFVKQGQSEPACVREEKTALRGDSDPIVDWLDTHTEYATGTKEWPAETKARELYLHYYGTVSKAGASPVTETTFGRKLSNKNIPKKRRMDGVFYGVRLKTPIPSDFSE